MKKTLSIFSLLVIFTLCFISCDINSSRPLTAKITIEVTDVYKDIGAVAIFCNLNEWKASEVMEHNDIYIADVDENRKATFVLNDYTLATTLKFQFTPMKDRNVTLGDDWWSYAISGSSQYSNNKNKITCDFKAKNKGDGCKVIINKSTYGASYWDTAFPIYGISPARWFNESYDSCFSIID